MKTNTKRRKKQVISLTLPGDVIDFYRNVSKLAGCTVDQAILVVVAIETVKINRK